MKKTIETSLDFKKKFYDLIRNEMPELILNNSIDVKTIGTLLDYDDYNLDISRYNFSWNGKENATKSAFTPSSNTLIFLKDKSIKPDKTNNIYIEGDNLEVLKLLQKTYNKKIDTIYIDPPYNTGNDFTYRDNYTNTLKGYIDQTSQKNSANPESSGRFHTNWLNMIYPRLLLSKNLLSDSGVIYISIDDNEYANLKKICDEIFGEGNFVSNMIWRKKFGGGQDANHIIIEHEYILMYAKNKEKLTINNNVVKRKKEDYIKEFNGKKAKIMRLEKWGVGAKKEDAPSLYYPIKNPNGVDYYPVAPDGSDGRWRKKPQNLDNDHITWIASKGKLRPYEIIYLDELDAEVEVKTRSILYDLCENADGTKEVRDIFEKRDVFEYPKPSKLIKKLIELSTKRDSIVLDFFSGSGTTAQSVMELNVEDGGNRKFILVQLPELINSESEASKMGFSTICDLAQTRIIKVANKLQKTAKKEEIQLKDPFSHSENFKSPDYGLKVFKLESSNIIPWDGTLKFDESTLLSQTEVIKQDRAKLDVLYEIMLKYGVFDKPIQEININGKRIYNISSGYLIVCLNDDITLSDVKEIGKLKPRNVIFKESGFINDNDKINATYTLEKLGVEEVKSI
jgi:adenine-specific DNA-methyltransferase